MDAPSVSQIQIQHQAVCPICGRSATKETSWPQPNDVRVAAFLCPDRHAWTTKWLAVTA